MKRVRLVFMVVLISYMGLYAQSNPQFGLKGGLSFTFFNADEGEFGTNPETDIEIYGGVFLDFKIKSGFHIQPEVLYIGLGDFEFINAPIYVKYDVAKAMSIAVGPSLNYFFDFFVNKFKVRADVNTAFHITEALDINLKYTLGFEEISPNVLFLGIGYRL